MVNNGTFLQDGLDTDPSEFAQIADYFNENPSNSEWLTDADIFLVCNKCGCTQMASNCAIRAGAVTSYSCNSCGERLVTIVDEEVYGPVAGYKSGSCKMQTTIPLNYGSVMFGVFRPLILPN